MSEMNKDPSLERELVKLSQNHIKAVNRPRRIVDQLDGMDVLIAVDTDIDTWLKFVFTHADMPESPIDSIFWDVGMSMDTYSVYDSDILPRMRFPHLEKYWDKGIDWVAELVRASHERGIEAFWNARVSEMDVPQPWTDNCNYFADRRCDNPFKAEHPDWVLPCWNPRGLWNLASQGLCEHKVKVLRELAERYEFDGISVDFSRHTPCLPPGRQWELRDHVTEYMRMLRLALMDVAQARGTPILLAAKVPENPVGCHMDGLDVETWAKEKLVDILVLGSRTSTIDVYGFRQIIKDTHVRLIPSFDRAHSTDGYYNPPIEYLRGVFGNFMAQGADGICTFNWPCATQETYAGLENNGDVNLNFKFYRHEGRTLAEVFNPGQFTQILKEIETPEIMVGKPLVFAVERRGGYPWAEGCHNRNDDRPLPCPLTGDGKAVSMPMFVYPPFVRVADKWSAELSVVLWPACNADEIEVCFNGKKLDCVESDTDWTDPQIYFDKPQPNAGNHNGHVVYKDRTLVKLRFPVSVATLHEGMNEVSLKTVRKESGHESPFVVEKVEAHLTPV